MIHPEIGTLCRLSLLWRSEVGPTNNRRIASSLLVSCCHPIVYYRLVTRLQYPFIEVCLSYLFFMVTTIPFIVSYLVRPLYIIIRDHRISRPRNPRNLVFFSKCREISKIPKCREIAAKFCDFTTKITNNRPNQLLKRNEVPEIRSIYCC